MKGNASCHTTNAEFRKGYDQIDWGKPKLWSNTPGTAPPLTAEMYAGYVSNAGHPGELHQYKCVGKVGGTDPVHRGVYGYRCTKCDHAVLSVSGPTEG